MSGLTCGTVQVFTNAHDALIDANRRPIKATWKNKGARLWAVGDWRDLPAHVDGLWREISAAELEQAATRDRPCSWCRKCANYGHGCADWMTAAEHDAEAARGFNPGAPDCYERE